VGKCPRLCRLKPTWTLLCSLTLVASFPVSLAGQGVAPTMATPQTAVLGVGMQAPLQFAGHQGPANETSLAVGTSFLYDDNIFATNALRAGDEAVSFNSHLAFTRLTEHLEAKLDYLPFFVLYRTYDQYDRLNHFGSLNFDFRLSSRVILGLFDGINYQNGLYSSLTTPPILSGPPSPTALDQAIVPYTTRSLSNMSGVSLTFMKSQRT